MFHCRIIITLLCGMGCLTTHAQNLSNKGKEFWVGYGHHQFFENASNSQQMVLYLSAEQAANVTVSINGTTYAQTYQIAANSVIASLPLPKSGKDDCRLFSGAAGFTGTLSEGYSQKGIHIVSDVPIVAYAHIYGSVSSGATMLLPAETWGYAYTSVNSKQAYAANCFSWMYIIARENNTRVQITPSGPTRGGRPSGIPFEIVLNKGQVYQMLGANISTYEGHELTGTKVTSIANASGKCFPIAVFSGSSRTWNPASCGSGGGDNDLQQLFPSQAWGRHYLTAPTSFSSNASQNQTNTFKILIKDPLTVVKRNGVVLKGLIANTYYIFESNSADYISADKPIMVAQFMTGGNCSGGITNLGDPEMIYISPMEQSIKRTGFYRNNQQAIIINYLTLIIPTKGLQTLTIDGSLNYDHAYEHPAYPGYTVIIKRWQAAQAQCIVQSDSAFTAITYGLGSIESYGYNAGTMINDLNIYGSIYNTHDLNSASHEFTCRNTPLEISLFATYKPESMVWNLSQVQGISPNQDVSITSPIPVDSILKNGTWFYQYKLPGVYTFSDTGIFQVQVKNTHPSIEKCSNSETVHFNIVVKRGPEANFSYSHNRCLMDSVQFHASYADDSYKIKEWLWSFSDSTTSSDKNPYKVFTSSGIQKAQLKAITNDGCVSDTTEIVQILARPSSSLETLPNALCVGESMNLSASIIYGGTNATSSYWDLGNNATFETNNNNTQTFIYPAYGKYTVKHVVKVGINCMSDTVSKILTVYAKPTLNFSYPTGCLPFQGMVQFNNSSTVADDQTMSYSWDFGDPLSSSSNPNASTLPNPTHQYAEGNYKIRYGATTVNGCMKDTGLVISFNVKPVVSFPVLEAVCESNSNLISIAKGVVTNGVQGKGFYKGIATDSVGQFNPTLAGPGLHKISFVFASTGGCQDSALSYIRVHPKPDANFTVQPDICLNQLANITDQSSISVGNITTWKWDFGDASSSSVSSGNQLQKLYTGYGHYTILLTVVSDKNCSSNPVARNITVHSIPEVNFTLPQSVCMPEGKADFLNQTKNSDNGIISYQWNFGDMTSISTLKHPSHLYTAKGSYKVQLTTTSSFGCTASSYQILENFFDKPSAQFNVLPDTVCQGSNAVFSSSGNPANNMLASWNWKFGDGSTSRDSSPEKKYLLPGKYVVSLTVNSIQGCASAAFTDTVIVYKAPVINAGPSFIVATGTFITFNPTARDASSLKFQWSPSVYFPNAGLLRPSIIAKHNETYILSAMGVGNCWAKDSLSVTVLNPVHAPNSFSPNGDGINDVWQIPNLAAYPGCSIEVYNRYGQIVYKSTGYSNPWDGKSKGMALPFATYYFIINLNNGFAPVSGSVTIIK